MNVDLTFPNLACGDLTVELWRTTVRSQPRGMEKTLRVSAYNPASKRKKRYERIVGDDTSSKSEGFTGCEVEGFINAYNSPGSLKISAPANANLSHTVNAFSFGLPLNRDQSRQLSKLSAKYRAVNEATLRDAAYHYHSNDKVFHHFIHVVPTKRGGQRPPLEKRRRARVPPRVEMTPLFPGTSSTATRPSWRTRRSTSRARGRKGDPTSLQRGCFRSNARDKSIHALSSPREMIARPKMSQIESKPIEIRASKVGNFTPFSCPGRTSRITTRPTPTSTTGPSASASTSPPWSPGSRTRTPRDGTTSSPTSSPSSAAPSPSSSSSSARPPSSSNEFTPRRAALPYARGWRPSADRAPARAPGAAPPGARRSGARPSMATATPPAPSTASSPRGPLRSLLCPPRRPRERVGSEWPPRES